MQRFNGGIEHNKLAVEEVPLRQYNDVQPHKGRSCGRSHPECDFCQFREEPEWKPGCYPVREGFLGMAAPSNLSEIRRRGSKSASATTKTTIDRECFLVPP
jgi:hypothetical protein